MKRRSGFKSLPRNPKRIKRAVSQIEQPAECANDYTKIPSEETLLVLESMIAQLKINGVCYGFGFLVAKGLLVTLRSTFPADATEAEAYFIARPNIAIHSTVQCEANFCTTLRLKDDDQHANPSPNQQRRIPIRYSAQITINQELKLVSFDEDGRDLKWIEAKVHSSNVSFFNIEATEKTIPLGSPVVDKDYNIIAIVIYRDVDCVQACLLHEKSLTIKKILKATPLMLWMVPRSTLSQIAQDLAKIPNEWQNLAKILYISPKEVMDTAEHPDELSLCHRLITELTKFSSAAELSRALSSLNLRHIAEQITLTEWIHDPHRGHVKLNKSE